MYAQLNFRAFTLTLLFGLLLSYILCILGGLLFGWTMYEVWIPLLPGFTWPITGGGFLLGLLWLVLYSLYGAAVIVLPYNYFTKQSHKEY